LSQFHSGPRGESEMGAKVGSCGCSIVPRGKFVIVLGDDIGNLQIPRYVRSR
jgi:hypothetical protein